MTAKSYVILIHDGRVGSVILIHDGSKPVGAAMNDYSQHDTVKFKTLQDACQLAKSFY